MSEPEALDVRLLGPLEVRRDGRIVKLGGAKPRKLLAALVLHLGEAVSVDRLIDGLWGESPPESASHAVEVYVSQLRKALGPARGLLERCGPGYALRLEPDSVDVHTLYMGGGFGRRAAADYIGEAVETSKLIGAPVKLTWSREDDLQQDLYRPASSLGRRCRQDGAS